MLLAAALILTFRNSGDHREGPQKPSGVANSVKVELGPLLDPAASETSPVTRSGRRKANIERALENGNFPQIERILVNPSLTTEQAAEQLLGIVQRPEFSEGERFEALAHGLNLSFKTFATAAADPALSAPLAQRYLDELANHNEARQGQIEGCLALMGNADEDIRTQAAEQLAFYIEAEAMAEQPEELRKAAQAWLDKLKAEGGGQKPEDGDVKKF